MKLLIDADACPVVDLAIRAAQSADCEVVLYCDTAHQMERDGARTVVVGTGADHADLALVNDVKPGDIVLTQDYGLAALALAKRAAALNQNGLIYTQQNIDGLLMSRHIGQKIRRGGGKTRGPKKRTHREDTDFLVALNMLLKKQG